MFCGSINKKLILTIIVDIVEVVEQNMDLRGRYLDIFSNERMQPISEVFCGSTNKKLVLTISVELWIVDQKMELGGICLYRHV